MGLGRSILLAATLVTTMSACGFDVPIATEREANDPSRQTKQDGKEVAQVRDQEATQTPDQTTKSDRQRLARKHKSTHRVLDHVFPLVPSSVADYGPGHHDYPATDIFAPEGTPFVAVTSGVVDYVSRQDTWDPAVDDPATRGGISVALVGDDGVRYYGSHLTKVAPGIVPGVRVEAGQVLGFTGDSGNARGTTPHLHFGVSHPTFPTDWEVRRGEVDTYPLLRSWQAHRNASPVLQ